METKKKIIIFILVIFVIGLTGAGIYLVITPSSTSSTTSSPTSSTTSESTSSSTSESTLASTSSILSPFRVGVSLETLMNEDGGGKAVYLDRHDIDCQENSINQLKLSRNNEGNSYNYKYTCSQGGNLNTSIDFSNNPSESSNNAIFLDRQPIACEKDSVLSRLRLRTLGDGKWTYDYKCKKSNSPLTCTDKSTPLNEEGGGNALYLDRHNIQCDDNESLSALALVRNGQGQWQYKYKCCKYPTTETFSYNIPQYLRHLQNKNFLLY